MSVPKKFWSADRKLLLLKHNETNQESELSEVLSNLSSVRKDAQKGIRGLCVAAFLLPWMK